MKIYSTNSVLKTMLIIIVSSLVFHCIASKDDVQPAGTQVTAYPNTSEAPTTKEQLGKTPSASPLISRALQETDPQRSLRKNEFVNTLKYGLHQLTRGEAEQIFNFVDYDKKDLVSPKDWDNFVALFVLPFESCDADGNKLLNEDEFKNCFTNDPRSKFIQFRRRYEETKVGIIMDTISTRGKRDINFADYLFIRKALYGWQQCHSHLKYIAKSSFRCALNNAIPNKYHLKMDIEKIYSVGLDLISDKNLIELDFIGYLRVTYFTYLFTVLSAPHDTPYLEKTQWLKAIREDRLPNNFEESEVNYIFELINTNPLQDVTIIDYASWCFFFNLHKLFNTYSHDKPLQLTLAEFQNLLKDPFISKPIVMAIDGSLTNFTEDKYLEASLILKRNRLSESAFFKFKQDASITTNATNDPATINNSYYEVKPDEAKRAVFFTIMADTDKQHWLKSHLYKAFQLANLFVTFVGDSTETKPIPVIWFIEKLPSFYDTVVPPICMRQRSNLSNYKSLPTEVYIDILTFLSLENFNTKFKAYTMSTTMMINETVLKTILQDFGMANMPETVLDTANRGYDALKRRQFDPREVIRDCITVHAVAAEQERNEKYIAKNKLKVNNDPSRKYPDLKRRSPISSKV